MSNLKLIRKLRRNCGCVNSEDLHAHRLANHSLTHRADNNQKSKNAMNIYLNSLVTGCCLLSATSQLHAQGYIVPNGVVYVGDIRGLGYEIDVLHNPAPTNGAHTGFFLQPQNPTTFLFAGIVDIGVRVFFVSANDPVSLQPILAQEYPELTYPNQYVFQDGVPFFVGLYTGNVQFPPPNGIYSDPLFGWAELENVNGAIWMLSSALEYGGGGIYAGTEDIMSVPEPCALGVLCLGVLAMGWRTRAALSTCGRAKSKFLSVQFTDQSPGDQPPQLGAQERGI
jgi:hypothetical protein